MPDSASSSFELDARLHVTASEGGQLRQFPIGVPTVEGMALVIGRSRSVDLTIHDDYISNKHLKITFRGGEHWLEDLGSTHGTLLNEQPVKKTVALKTGDVVTLGKSRFEYRCTRRALEDVGSIAEFVDPPPEVSPAAPPEAEKKEPENAEDEATRLTGVTLANSVRNVGAKQAAAKKAAEAEAQASAKTPAKPATPAAAKDSAKEEPAREGGAGFGTLVLAFLGVAAILALVCYLAWQVFFAGKS